MVTVIGILCVIAQQRASLGNHELGILQMEYNEGVAVLLHYFLFLQKTDCLDMKVNGYTLDLDDKNINFLSRVFSIQEFFS